jgi:hypothetical protein
LIPAVRTAGINPAARSIRPQRALALKQAKIPATRGIAGTLRRLRIPRQQATDQLAAGTDHPARQTHTGIPERLELQPQHPTLLGLMLFVFTLVVGALVTQIGYSPFFACLSILNIIGAIVLWTLVPEHGEYQTA